MQKELSVSQIVKYGGHTTNKAGVVAVTFIADYSELVGTVQTLQTLGEDVTIGIKVAGRKGVRLGTFKVKSILTNAEGISKLKFESIRDSVEMDVLDTLPLMQDDVPAFKVMYKATIEVEDEDA